MFLSLSFTGTINFITKTFYICHNTKRLNCHIFNSISGSYFKTGIIIKFISCYSRVIIRYYDNSFAFYACIIKL
ncbi:hypothetical protein HZS_5952 [Henneguya salminicola]|nr:hypothetical protein HZS_5952 [Henneguya salminicola]